LSQNSDQDRRWCAGSGRCADAQVVQDAEASNENTASSSLLDDIVRDGAWQMLATALQAEVLPLLYLHGLSSSDSGLALE
jgi:hypothetical protein